EQVGDLAGDGRSESGGGQGLRDLHLGGDPVLRRVAVGVVDSGLGVHGGAAHGHTPWGWMGGWTAASLASAMRWSWSDSSMPMKPRPSARAATPVVPDPANGSSIVPPGGALCSSWRIWSRGFSVGWCRSWAAGVE